MFRDDSRRFGLEHNTALFNYLGELTLVDRVGMVDESAERFGRRDWLSLSAIASKQALKASGI